MTAGFGSRCYSFYLSEGKGEGISVEKVPAYLYLSEGEACVWVVLLAMIWVEQVAEDASDGDKYYTTNLRDGEDLHSYLWEAAVATD